MGEIVTLPAKPSELLSLALSDLTLVEREPSFYEIRMNNWWHDTPSSGKTQVCFAGCVMAKTLGLKREPNKNLMPSYFSNINITMRLRSLNVFRQGNVYTGLLVNFSKSEAWVNAGKPHHFPITPYEKDKNAFKHDIQKLVVELDSCGL